MRRKQRAALYDENLPRFANRPIIGSAEINPSPAVCAVCGICAVWFHFASKKCRGQFSDAGYSVDVFSVLTFTLFVVRGFYLALGIFWKADVGFSVTLLLSCSPV